MENDKERVIIELSTTKGYDPKIIELLYDFTNGDKAGIEKILNTIPKNLMLVKANFDAKPIEKKGFFYFVYDISKHEMIDKGIFAYRGLEKIDFAMPWEKLRAKILQWKIEDKFDKIMWSFYEKEIKQEGFLKELKRIVTDFMGMQKFKNLLETLVQKGLTPVFYNKNFTLELDFELMDSFVFFAPTEEERKKAEEEKQKQAEEEKKEEENIVVKLKVSPVLDPVGGRLVKELSSEDLVLFDLKDEREEAFYIADLLRKKSNQPMIGKVKSYSIIDQDTIKLNIFFAPGIWGESIVPNSVLVSVVKPTDKDFMQKEDPEKNFIKISHKSFIMAIFVVMFIILLFLLFFY